MRPKLLRTRAGRGVSLVEVMVSLALLAIGLLGVAQMQIIASAQNGAARKASRAAAIARDFTEAAMRWEYADPRLVAGTCGTGVPPTENSLGFAQRPLGPLGFTATSSSHPDAALQGAVADGLVAGGTHYDGAEASNLDDASMQLLWSVHERDTNPSSPGCEAKVVTVVVRYPIGGSNYRNLITSFVKYNNRLLGLAGIPEQI